MKDISIWILIVFVLGGGISVFSIWFVIFCQVRFFRIRNWYRRKYNKK